MIQCDIRIVSLGAQLIDMLWKKIKIGFRRLAGLRKEHFVLSGLLGRLIDKLRSHSADKPYTESDKLSVVPTVIYSNIAGDPKHHHLKGFLSEKDKENLSLSTKYLFTLRPVSRDEVILAKFLSFIAHGEQDKAEGLLKCGNPSKWLLMKGTFTDYSGRTFHCTAYQYAFWVKDIHMCRMLEKHMDKETKAEILKLIYNDETKEDRELDYEQNGIHQHSAHFNITPLKQTYEEFLKAYDGLPVDADWKEKNQILNTYAAKVAKAQRDVPAHIAQEYCHPFRTFFQCLNFNKSTLTRRLNFENWNTGKKHSWFPLDGYTDGRMLYRLPPPVEDSVWAWRGEWWGTIARKVIVSDMKAFLCLDKERTSNLRQSLEYLKNQPAILDEQRLPSP